MKELQQIPDVSLPPNGPLPPDVIIPVKHDMSAMTDVERAAFQVIVEAIVNMILGLVFRKSK